MPPSCLDSVDANDSGQVDLSDPIYLLIHLFADGGAPPEPHLACGADATADVLGCERYEMCRVDEFTRFVTAYDILDTVAGKGEFREKGDNRWEERFEGGPAIDAELSRPHTAMADEAGLIYIADKDAHAIRKVTLDGNIVTIAGTSTPGDGDDNPGPGTERSLTRPNGLYVRGDGTAYVLDVGNQKVRRLSPDGVLTLMFWIPGFELDRGLWVSGDEHTVFVSANEFLLRWTAADGLENYTPGQVYLKLENLDVDSRGNVILADRDANRLYMVTPAREVIPIAGNGTPDGGGDGYPALETGINGVRGVWIVNDDSYLLATHEGSQVWYVDSDGIAHIFLDGAPTHVHAGDGLHFRTPGLKISEAGNITMGPHGNIFVTENDFGYVRIIRRKC